MKTYTLYLDESETNQKQTLHAYAIGGIIVENTYHDTVLSPQINQVKQKIWSDLENYQSIILHEKEVKDATSRRVDKSHVKPEYIRFYNNFDNCTIVKISL